MQQFFINIITLICEKLSQLSSEWASERAVFYVPTNTA